MPIKNPEIGLPQQFRGGSDLWDFGLAGQIVTNDFFPEIIPGAFATGTLDFSGSTTSTTAPGTRKGIQYVGGLNLRLSGNTSYTNLSIAALTGGIDTAPIEGDLVIVSYAVSCNTGDPNLHVLPTEDYYQIWEHSGTGTTRINLAVFGCFLGPGFTTDLQIAQTGSAQWAGGVTVHVFRNVDPNPYPPSYEFFENEPVITTGTTGQIVPAPITIDGVGSMVFLAAAQSSIEFSGGTYPILNSPDLVNFIESGNGDTYDVGMGAGIFFPKEGVAWTPAPWTGGTLTEGDNWVSIAFALRSAPLDVVGSTGTATGTLPLSGAADATALAQAVSAGTLDLAGLSSATAPIAAAASGVLPLSGVSTVSGSLAGLNAAASGSISFSGVTTARADIRAASAGTLSFTGSAASSGSNQIVATGSLALSGSSSAKADIKALTSGALSLGGAATSKVDIASIAAGLLPLSGAASSGGSNQVTGTGTIALAGSSAAAVRAMALAAGALDFTGLSSLSTLNQVLATGLLPLAGAAQTVAPISGTSTGTLSLSGAATAGGLAQAAASATGLLGFVGSALAAVLVKSTLAAQFDLTGVSEARVSAQALSTGSLSLSGAATSFALVQGLASSLLPFTGSATGTVLQVNGGYGTLDLTGTATARALVEAIASSSISLTGASTVAVLLSSTAVGSITFTLTARLRALNPSDLVTRHAYAGAEPSGGQVLTIARSGILDVRERGGSVWRSLNTGKLEIIE